MGSAEPDFFRFSAKSVLFSAKFLPLPYAYLEKASATSSAESNVFKILCQMFSYEYLNYNATKVDYVICNQCYHYLILMEY